VKIIHFPPLVPAETFLVGSRFIQKGEASSALKYSKIQVIM